MNTLLTFPLAERIGWMLLHSLWQIAAIGFALIVGRWFFRSPQARHLLAMIALVACVAWPVAGLWQAGKAEPRKLVPVVSSSGEGEMGDAEALGSSASDHSTEAQAQGTPNGTDMSYTTYTSYMSHLRALTQSRGALLSHLRALTHSRRALPTLAAAWLIGVIVLTLRHAGALCWLHRLRTCDTQPAPVALLAVARAISARLGLRRGFHVLVSARALAPMVVGTLRPVVLLPASVLTGFSPDQVEALLAHELAHLRRWDDVLNLLQCAIETLLFFHPAVWWISRRAREDRELCADDLATARGIERHTLAQALGRLALDGSPALALAATGHMPVLTRIRRLLLPPPAPMRLNAWPLITLIILASGFGIQPRAQADAPPRGRILDRNGVVLAESPSIRERRYPKQTLAAHVLGFAGQVNRGKPELFGRSGIELSQEATLAAKQDVQLTLDAEIQDLTEAILQKHARNGGAAVVLDANTGDILALASNPMFNPNDFVPRITAERFDALRKDTKNPLFGRAFQAAYFPASTFKLVTALAGLKSGAIDEKTIFDGAPEFKIGDRTFRNWHKYPEGSIDLVTALKRSCNTWFYQAALKTGANPITTMASDLGFGQPTGLPLPEGKTFVPTDAYYQQTQGHKMLPGVLASLSIGQITTATPLQVAVATAAIGNGGKVLVPRLLKTPEPAQVRTDLLAKGLKPEHLDLVKRGMSESVHGARGTSHAAQIEGITVAGKTGTAQWVVNEDQDKSRSLGWFTGFAPAGNPRLVVTVVYEGSFGEAVSGGAVAAPIAQEIMKGALEKLKPVSWIDVLDQQWLETASRLSVPADPGTTILYHPNAQNLAPGPIRATDIAVIDAKNPTRVQFFHGDGRITVGKDGKATIDADEATFVTSLDVLPEHWQRAVKGQPKNPDPPPAWINAEWLQSAKSTTVPFKAPLSNPLMDPSGPACVFYDGEMKHHEKPDAEQVTSFTGNVVFVNGQMLISGQKITIHVSSTGKISAGGHARFGFVNPGELPALDAATKSLQEKTEKPASNESGSTSYDTKASPAWLTKEWMDSATLTILGGTGIHSSGIVRREFGDTVIHGLALFRDQTSNVWKASISPDTLRFRADGVPLSDPKLVQPVSTKILVGLMKSMSARGRVDWSKHANLAQHAPNLAKLEAREPTSSSRPRRHYPNPWPFDSAGPADIIVSSDGRSYDYVPGRGASLPLLDERRSTVTLDFEPSLWEARLKPAAEAGNPVVFRLDRPHYSKSMPDLISIPADADSTTIRNLFRAHFLRWPLVKGQADFEYRDVGPKQPDHQVSPLASKVVEPHLVPSWEKFQPIELPKPPDTLDDLLSEPRAPKIE